MDRFEGVTLEEAKQWLRERVDKGAKCPCCTQMAKVYRRHMTSTTGRTMIAMYRYHGTDWVNIPDLMKLYLRDVAHQGGYATLAQHWGLIIEERTARDDGGRPGWWHLTSDGVMFVKAQLKVPRKVTLYDNRLLGIDDSQMVSIHDVLGEHFNLAELMGDR
jgi:hypothetical protein